MYCEHCGYSNNTVKRPGDVLEGKPPEQIERYHVEQVDALWLCQFCNELPATNGFVLYSPYTGVRLTHNSFYL